MEFLQKDDEEGRIQALSALVNSFQKENDLQTALRTAMCIGNLCHENDEVYSMITFTQPHTSLRKAASALDNIVVIDGLSK